MAGVIGCLQALEAVKFLTGAGELLTGKLLTYDALTNNFRTVKLPHRVPDCPVCGDHPTITKPIDYEQAECEGAL
jgi:molybdopterin/thiamine biosynthesis adenylyltransferase